MQTVSSIFNQLLADHSDVDNKYIFLAYTGIGLIYMNQADYDKAEYFFEKAIHQIDSYTIESVEDVCRCPNKSYITQQHFMRRLRI